MASILIDPGVSRIRADDPQALDLVTQDAFDDLVVRPAWTVMDETCVDAHDVGDFLPMSRVGEIVPSQQVGRVAEQP